MNNTKNKKGFTLVELIVVIMIIGILAATLLPKIMGAPARARDAARVADLNNISAALQSYYADYGEYPSAATNATDTVVSCLDPTTTDTNAVAYKLINGGYLRSNNFPTDPIGIAAADGGCTDGQYTYMNLYNSQNNTVNDAFMLISDIEIYQNGNYNASTGAPATNLATTTVSGWLTDLTSSMLDTDTQYLYIGGI